MQSQWEPGTCCSYIRQEKATTLHTHKEKVEEMKGTLIKFLFKEWLSLSNITPRCAVQF